MLDGERAGSGSWIEELLAAHADEMGRREIRVRCDLDPRFQIREEEELEAALVELFRFAFSTIPDGCEIFVASARELTPVSALDSGSLTVRWQTTGNEREGDHARLRVLRPVAGGARKHIESMAAARLRDAFEVAGWDLELFAMTEDREVWARANNR